MGTSNVAKEERGDGRTDAGYEDREKGVEVQDRKEIGAGGKYGVAVRFTPQ